MQSFCPRMFMVNNLILMGGLPRSGNTLLSALLNQNPDMYVTTTSPFVELLWRNYSMWDEIEYTPTFGAEKIKNARSGFLKKLQDSFHSELTNRKNVVDKRRQWQNVHNIKMYIDIYGVRPKILCPVRDVPEIISSFDTLFKSNKIEFDYDKELSGNRFGESFHQLKEAYFSEYKDCLFLIEFEDLIKNTQSTLDKVYDYLGIKRFKHDINNISALESEPQCGIVGLHTLPPKVISYNPDLKSREKFKDFNDWGFWK